MKNPTLIRLYGILPYDRSAKARWLLTELGVPFENRWLDGEKKEHESPDFLRLTPFGRVPVLETDDMVMFESGAICAYLADRYLEQGMAPALSSPHRMEYQQWMYFAAATLDPFQIRIMVIEDIPPGEVQTTKQAALVEHLHDAMAALDATLAKNDYLVANRFSAADICVGYHLYWLTLWPELNSVIETFPRVKAYRERLAALPSARKADVFSYQG